MFKKIDSSVIIMTFILALFVYEVYDAVVSRDKSLKTVCASYSKLVDAINSEVPAGDYTINGEKFPDTKTEEGEKHYHMITLHHKIAYECRNVYGITSSLPSPQELRGK
jgi:hypothetical protein